jgi:membrane-bound lytic murein transglycosylase B
MSELLMRKIVSAILLTTAACAPVAELRPIPVARAEASAPSGNCAAPLTALDRGEGQPRLILASLATWTPPRPTPPLPPENTGDFLRTHWATFTPTGDARFDAHVQRVLNEGGPAWRPYLLRLFAGLKLNPAILAEAQAMRRPANAAEYVGRIVTPERIANGRRLYSGLRGSTLSAAQPNVPPEIVIALWGALGDYGAGPPRFDMLETLLNLGACGMGPAFTYFDIYHAARLILEGKVERSRAKAYGNGRIGQVQALVHESGSLGADGDGDGAVDLWTNRADIFANLAPIEWQAGVPAIIEVERPRFDRSDPRQARMARAFESEPSLALEHFPRPGGGAWPTEWLRAGGGRFVAPFGDQGPFFVLMRNFTPLNYKNPYVARYASLDEDPGFGIAISLLADAIAGRPGPSRAIR